MRKRLFPLAMALKVGLKAKGERAAKTILFTMLAVCMVFGLSSCGGTAKETKESQVKDDVLKILSQDADFSGYNLDVNSFSVSKRQTNTEDKTDFVWCDIAATGNALIRTEYKFSCSIECKITYVLYNDGWQLDSYTCNIVDSSIKPLSYPTQEQVEEVASKPNGMVPVQVEIYDMIQKSDTEVVYPVDRYFIIGDMTLSKGELTFKFAIEQGWYCPR